MRAGQPPWLQRCSRTPPTCRCSGTAAARYAAVWLLHPFSINISTRGNADALVGVLVLGSLHLLLRRRIRASAVLYGLSVHFKLYPIVYALSFYLFLDEVDYGGHQSDDKVEKAKRANDVVRMMKIHDYHPKRDLQQRIDALRSDGPNIHR